MAWEIDSIFEKAMWVAAESVAGRSALLERNLVPAIQRRSQLYTDNREDLQTATNSEAAADLGARAVFFSLSDAPKILIPLEELFRAGVAPGETVRVLDLGAGAGAMTLGLANWYLQRDVAAKIDVVAVDKDAEALAVFERWAKIISDETEIEVSVERKVADLDGGQRGRGGQQPKTGADSSGKYDLILAGTLLNELPNSLHVATVRKFAEQLTDDGALIIVEPALRETSRALHEVRDEILQKTVAHIFAPCVRKLTPCPALENEADWCHEDRKTNLPPKAARLSQFSGLRRHGVKFSYLTIRRAAVPQIAAEKETLQQRVVSRPAKSKGALECFVCGDSGRFRLRILKRNKSDANRALFDAGRGDLIEGVRDKDVCKDQTLHLHALEWPPKP